MRQDSLLVRVAKELGLRVVAPLAGGAFGATLVEDSEGRELVLKALPSEAWAPRFARGAALAERLRAAGYPAPAYAGTGVALGASWSLQERLRGETPDVVTVAHARRLLELASMHSGAATAVQGDAAAAQGNAGEGNHRWRDEWSLKQQRCLATVLAEARTRALAKELAAVIERSADVHLLDDGIVHGDFNHRNFLAIGDEVTGVFDWEFASTGDWRFDVFLLAYWSRAVPACFDAEARLLLSARVEEICVPEVLAFFAAHLSLRQLDFDVREHPERVSAIVDAIEREIAAWWRGG